MIEQLQNTISENRNQLLNHKLYKNIKTPQDIKTFLQFHVYAVWDFMSLLKALQQQLTCTTSPWLPTANPETRYLINEIVLAEETDVNQAGQRQSHYEMYLDAMLESKADITEITHFLEVIKENKQNIFDIIENHVPHSAIKDFLNFTFSIIKEGKPHKIAAAFTFGREDLIPEMFTAILKEMQQNFPAVELGKLIYYFDRHISLDEDEHGPMALQMVSELCGTNEQLWKEAATAANEALQVRIALWNSVNETITSVTA